MSLSTTTSKIEFKLHRFSTILTSFKTLYTLPQEKVDAFLGSYDLYQHDWADEDELKLSMGADYYSEVKRKLIDYYSVLNHLCSIGQIEKMYIPPAMGLSKSLIANQALFEQKMSRDLSLRVGTKALDIGCGRGRIASEIAAYSGADVTGLNLHPDQVANASRFAVAHGLAKQCRFQVGDMNDLPLPFGDNSFDAVYQVQAFSYSKDLKRLAKDIYRLLKPGAKLACLDWVTLPDYDKTNALHSDLMKRIKPLLGAIGSPSDKEYVHAFKQAGLDILISENASIDGLQAPLIQNTDQYFTRVAALIRGFVCCRVLPEHFNSRFERLTKDGQAFLEADRLRLVTTSYYIGAKAGIKIISGSPVVVRKKSDMPMRTGRRRVLRGPLKEAATRSIATPAVSPEMPEFGYGKAEVRG